MKKLLFLLTIPCIAYGNNYPFDLVKTTKDLQLKGHVKSVQLKNISTSYNINGQADKSQLLDSMLIFSKSGYLKDKAELQFSYKLKANCSLQNERLQTCETKTFDRKTNALKSKSETQVFKRDSLGRATIVVSKLYKSDYMNNLRWISTSKIVINYDENKQTQSTYAKESDRSPRLVSNRIVDFDPQTKSVKKVSMYNGGIFFKDEDKLSLFMTDFFDENGYKVKTEAGPQTIFYTYKDNVLSTEKRVYQLTNNTMGIIEYTNYKFDECGNWIVRELTSDGQDSGSQERVITYYTPCK